MAVFAVLNDSLAEPEGHLSANGGGRCTKDAIYLTYVVRTSKDARRVKRPSTGDGSGASWGRPARRRRSVRILSEGVVSGMRKRAKRFGGGVTRST